MLQNCLEQGCDCELAPRAFQQGGQEARVGLLTINIISFFEIVLRDSGFAIPKALLCCVIRGGSGSEWGGVDLGEHLS